MCVTCKIPLNVAQSPQADRERAYIQGLIDRGRDRSADQARARRPVRRRPCSALPSTHGFDLAAYLVPLAVVLGAARDARACCCRAGAASPRAARARELPRTRRSAPPTPRAWTPTSRASTEPRQRRALRRGCRPAATSPAGALTPSSSRQRAIVRALATHSAIRERLDRLGLGADHAAVAVEGREVLRELAARRRRCGAARGARRPRRARPGTPAAARSARARSACSGSHARRSPERAPPPSAPASHALGPAFASIEAMRACAYCT